MVGFTIGKEYFIINARNKINYLTRDDMGELVFVDEHNFVTLDVYRMLIIESIINHEE